MFCVLQGIILTGTIIKNSLLEPIATKELDLEPILAVIAENGQHMP